MVKVLQLQLQHQSVWWIFRIDWFDLCAVQRTLKWLLQHHSSKTSILQCSAFFIVQLSHPYMTTRKTIALTIRTFVVKVMSLLFNMLSRFLPRSECLMAALTICNDFGAPKNNVCHFFHCFPVYLPWSVGTDAIILVFWMLNFKSTFSIPSFTSIRRLFSSSLLSSIKVLLSAYLRLLIFLPTILIPLALPPAQRFSWSTLHIS